MKDRLSGVDEEILKQRYEDLRKRVLGKNTASGAKCRSSGLVIFIRNGMVMWLDAWRELINTRDKSMKKESPAEECKDIKRDLENETVIILSNMVFTNEVYSNVVG